MEDLKSQIKAIFEANEFETAKVLAKDLLAEYEPLKGKRSVSALVAYCKRQSGKKVEASSEIEPAQEQAVEPSVEDINEATEECESSTGDNEESTDTTEPTNEIKEVKFSLYKEVDKEMLQKALDADCSEMKDFCVIKEYWEQKSDNEVIRTTEMFVDRDDVTLRAKGFATWDDASAKAKSAGLVSFRKKGDFSLSEEGFPVGEVYCKVTVMYIGKALQKFLHRENGIKEIKSIEIA